jgi:hypothetical protein
MGKGGNGGGGSEIIVKAHQLHFIRSTGTFLYTALIVPVPADILRNLFQYAGSSFNRTSSAVVQIYSTESGICLLFIDESGAPLSS